MSSLQKIKKTTLSDQVCKAIKDKIKTGEWAEDSRIPSENELAESFGVNRLTVRNALQKLNAMGLVETRAGEGTFIRKFDFAEYIREVSDLAMSPEMLEGVMEFRKCIELECIRLAMLRADDNDIMKLEELLRLYVSTTAEQTESFEKHVENIVEADLNFHYQICSLSKNMMFTLAMEAVREPLHQYIKSVLIKRFTSYSDKNKIAPEATGDHWVILDAIKRKDFEACKKVYMEMIDFNN